MKVRQVGKGEVLRTASILKTLQQNRFKDNTDSLTILNLLRVIK